jgi:four helix bundle protein
MGTFSFTQLDVWKKAHELTLRTYRLTESFPRKEAYRLTHQACTAAASVPANIAEGYGRRHAREKIRFYNIGEGSLQELRYYCILARDLGYLSTPEPFFDLIRDVESMLRRLIAAISRDL